MDKITIGIDQTWNERAPDGFPCTARAMAGGVVAAHAEIAYAPGHPRNRMNAAAVIEKFAGCTEKFLDDDQRARIVDTVMSLDRAVSVRELTQLLQAH